MSTSLTATETGRQWRVPGWGMAVLLLIGIAATGGALGGTSRLVFVIACGLVGWYAWRQGLGAHFQAALTLFVFAPFVRRIVELSAGYDQLGLMLIGPLLAILVPAIELPKLLEMPTGAGAVDLAARNCGGLRRLCGHAVDDPGGFWTNAASGDRQDDHEGGGRRVRSALAAGAHHQHRGIEQRRQPFQHAGRGLFQSPGPSTASRHRRRRPRRFERPDHRAGTDRFSSCRGRSTAGIRIASKGPISIRPSWS